MCMLVLVAKTATEEQGNHEDDEENESADERLTSIEKRLNELESRSWPVLPNIQSGLKPTSLNFL